MTEYHVSGDGTGITYVIYKGFIFDNPKLIHSGIKTLKEARKIIAELRVKDKEEQRL